mmetsp:Transcript_18773/g.27708  ORF Transcript_18773/g.27708 Transcript_18773/m.27708 type:complete len:518 (+) Transcript_18773:90-1643(+)
MSSSLLERARTFHEDIEAYELAVIKQLEQKPKTNKEKVYQQHRISDLLEKSAKVHQELDSLYEDKDRTLKTEISSMRGRDAIKNFYEKANQSWNYHARHPNLPQNNGPNIEDTTEPKVVFSGEELFGKYFDLHSFHMRWCNMPQCVDNKIEYGTFLSNLIEFDKIPENSKRSKTYNTYLKDLELYLKNFLERTQPLVDSSEIIKESDKEFENIWQSGKLKGWPLLIETNKSRDQQKSAYKQLDLNLYHSYEDLMSLGLERLKEALEAKGLKTGGNLKQRAERLMAIKGKTFDQIDKKLLAKPKNNTASEINSSNNKENQINKNDWRKSTALLEAHIISLVQSQSDVWEATQKQVEKKQTRTIEERDAEIADEEAGMLPDIIEDEDESDDDGPIYNPLNLPLGWDGKPIPFWLYKLHGLGEEFKCEICGDYSYWGRKAFDKHFQEWRHAHGMRCLGIPNTKHFHDITKIQDALDLFAKLKMSLNGDQWTAEAGEEFEDSEGNVLNRRTYEDLARQGLL